MRHGYTDEDDHFFKKKWHFIHVCALLVLHSTTVLPPFEKERNYVLRVAKSSSYLIKFLVNTIHIYGSKIIYYENMFHN
jgi:hypothetical protein